MYGRTRSYNRALIERDVQMQRLTTRLHLARCEGNKMEVTRLESHLKRLGQSMYPVRKSRAARSR